MSHLTASPSRRKPWLKRLIVLGAAIIVVLVGASVATGYGFNLRSFGRMLLNVTLAVANRGTVTQQHTGEYRNVVFLHHSVGAHMIEQSRVREKFTAAGYSFWDQGYNIDQLRDPAGNKTGYAYPVPGDNTDPDGLLGIFTQPAYGLPLNALSGLLQHEVIAFKSCFPASNITSDAQLQTQKDWYLKIRDTMDQHPDKLFVVITQPPLNPAETSPEAAARARAFANWLMSAEFRQGRQNIVAFDLFDQLAESNPQSPDFNMLRPAYRDGGDSHPNRLGNETIGPLLADFIIQAADQYRAVSAR